MTLPIKTVLVHLSIHHLQSLEIEVSSEFGCQIDDVFEGATIEDKILLFTVSMEPNIYERFVSLLRRKRRKGEIRALAHPLPVEGSWWVVILPSNGHLLQVVNRSAFEEPEIIDLTTLEKFQQEERRWERRALVTLYQMLRHHGDEKFYSLTVDQLTESPPKNLDELRSWARDRLVRTLSVNERQVLDRFLLDLENVGDQVECSCGSILPERNAIAMTIDEETGDVGYGCEGCYRASLHPDWSEQ